MFKEFWKEKGEMVQFAGLVIAIGALFLTIPLPTNNENARLALLNIQVIWFVFITIGIVTLCANFWKFLLLAEKKAKERYNIDFTETLSLIFFCLISWFLWNIWQYLISLYERPLWSMVQNVTQALPACAIVIAYASVAKLKDKIKPWLFFTAFLLILSLLLGSVALITFSRIASIYVWATFSLWIFIILSFISLSIKLVRVRFFKKGKDEIEVVPLVNDKPSGQKEGD